MSRFTKFENAYGYWEEDDNYGCLSNKSTSMIYSTDPDAPESLPCFSTGNCFEYRPWCKNFTGGQTYCDNGVDTLDEVFIPELETGSCVWNNCPSINPFPTPIPTNVEEGGAGYYNCVQWGCNRSFEIPGGDNKLIGKDCEQTKEECCNKCDSFNINCQACNETQQFQECEASSDEKGYCLAVGFGYPTNNFNIGDVDCVSCMDYKDELIEYTRNQLVKSGWEEDKIEDYMENYIKNFDWTHTGPANTGTVHKVPSNCLSECTKTAGQFAPNPMMM